MREILFRGKSIDSLEWLYGDYTGYAGGAQIWTHDENGATWNYIVATGTVGQYTGLTDKNGKKIFEGDIVDHYVQGVLLVNRGVVEWDERNGRWAHRLNTMNPAFCLYNPDAFEVIGNIHDNPELLNGGADNGDKADPV